MRVTSALGISMIAWTMFTGRRMLTLGDMINMAEKYMVRYHIIPGSKATLNPNQAVIFINPQYNEDGLSLTHEVVHHHMMYNECMDLPEVIIEMIAEQFYEENKAKIVKYVRKRLR